MAVFQTRLVEKEKTEFIMAADLIFAFYSKWTKVVGWVKFWQKQKNGNGKRMLCSSILSGCVIVICTEKKV